MQNQIPNQGTWSRLKATMESLNWSEQELADRSGVPQPTIHRIINGQSKSPRYENLFRIMKALGLDEGSFQVGEDPNSYTTNTREGPALQSKVPLISWVQAGDLCEAIDLFSPGIADEWLNCPFKHSDNAFCLKVVGLSMYPEYREGEIILVEPALEARHGDDVVVRTPENTTTFKRLHSSDDGTYLIALNPDLKNRIIEIPVDTVFCGVVTGSWTNRRNK